MPPSASPSKADSGLFGLTLPPIAGRLEHSFSASVEASSSSVASMLSPLQPNPDPEYPGRSIKVTVWPVSTWISWTCRSPTQVWSMVTETLRSAIVAGSLTVRVSVTPVELLSGIARLTERQNDPVTGVGVGAGGVGVGVGAGGVGVGVGAGGVGVGVGVGPPVEQAGRVPQAMP